MEAGLLETVGKVAGIGGIAVGVLLLLFRDIVRKNIFPKLAPKDAYRLLSQLTVFIFVVAIAGIAAWVFVEMQPEAVAPSAAVEAGQNVAADGNINVPAGGEGSGPAIRAGQDVNAGGDLNIGQ
jgi:hypothetical protein